jgi:hypothetical protein
VGSRIPPRACGRPAASQVRRARGERGTERAARSPRAAAAPGRRGAPRPPAPTPTRRAGRTPPGADAMDEVADRFEMVALIGGRRCEGATAGAAAARARWGQLGAAVGSPSSAMQRGPAAAPSTAPPTPPGPRPGRGAYGSVYKAVDRVTRRFVAIKIITLTDSDAQARGPAGGLRGGPCGRACAAGEQAAAAAGPPGNCRPSGSLRLTDRLQFRSPRSLITHRTWSASRRRSPSCRSATTPTWCATWAPTAAPTRCGS